MNNLGRTAEIANELKRVFDNISGLLKGNTEIFKQNKEFQNNLSEFAKSFVRVYTETSDNLLNISKYGWFLDLDCHIKYSIELNELIENSKFDLAEKSLIEYYEGNLEEIFSQLTQRHSSRKIIFKQLEKSFNEELYYLTIPTLFAQIDGICHDLTNKKFFLKNKDFLPEVYPKLEELNKEIADIFLSPLKNSSPMNVWEEEIEKFPLKFNRHEILHGVDINYGNRINSLKCLSLLKFISDIINRTKRKH